MFGKAVIGNLNIRLKITPGISRAYTLSFFSWLIMKPVYIYNEIAGLFKERGFRRLVEWVPVKKVILTGIEAHAQSHQCYH
jgi:hypothetical protein